MNEEKELSPGGKRAAYLREFARLDPEQRRFELGMMLRVLAALGAKHSPGAYQYRRAARFDQN